MQHNNILVVRLYCPVKCRLTLTMHATVAANSAPDHTTVSNTGSYYH